MRIPGSTYRLQVNQDFPLSRVVEIVDYLQELGITDLYLSPIQKAVPGSKHGYDGTDYDSVNPELGTEREFKELAEKLQAYDMGLILDIVPNHMHIGSIGNRWWQDVLEHGQKSVYADYFDIDWESHHPDLKGKILLPFLGEPLEEAIHQGKLSIKEQKGKKFIAYGSSLYPTNPDYQDQDLKTLLEKQHYRLDYWKRGCEDLNYRRFFEITELACLRQGNPQVFADVHRLVLEWVQKGWITGLRIDHVDGLSHPQEYLTKLREKVGKLYLVIEKILIDDERLRMEWDVQGTTGYDYLNSLNSLFIDQDLTGEYHEFTGGVTSPDDVEKEAKKHLLNTTMQSEWNFLAKNLPEDLQEPLFRFLISFPVYRFYGQSLIDQDMMDEAVAHANLSDNQWSALREHLFRDSSYIARLQQILSALMAKGVEDTAFYRYYPLSSTNEVGASLHTLPTSQEIFHERNIKIQEHWPHTMSTTTTHDTKRSEDVRSRINVLSEFPLKWVAALNRWHAMNEPYLIEGVPSLNEEYLLYQTLVGAWPLTKPSEHYVERICHYMLKAVKEAKENTSWVEPNETYEKSLQTFIINILTTNNEFIEDLDTFVKTEVLYPGRYNSLSQTLFKITSPGVPDFYQGSESWIFSLVDPDNRSQVDFDAMKKRLGSSSEIDKIHLIQKALKLRREQPQLFQQGIYEPIYAAGQYARNVVAYARRDKERSVITVGGRFFTHLDDPKNPFGRGIWKDTRIEVPEEKIFLEVLTGKILQPDQGELYIGDLFTILPVALLVEQAAP